MLVTLTLCDFTICAVAISAHMAIVFTLIYSLMLHEAWPMDVAQGPAAYVGGSGGGGKDDEDDDDGWGSKWKGEWPLNL